MRAKWPIPRSRPESAGGDIAAVIIGRSDRANTRLSDIQRFGGIGGPGILYETSLFAQRREPLCYIIGDLHFASKSAFALVSDNGYGIALDNGTIVCVNTPDCDCEITGVGFTYEFEKD